jgi:F-type H+-transporting ATPase subunit alpha
MTEKTDLVYLLEQALKQAPTDNVEEIGVVVSVGDDICQISGLTRAMYGELIEFEGGNRGIIFNMDEDLVAVFLLYNTIPVIELEVARRTGHVYQAPVGMSLLGRVISSLGDPLDGLGDINPQELRPVEVPAPQIIERSPINQSLETGILAIDALVPIGRGQRELIIGNRNTGKTAVALDAILHQKDKKVYCVYVAIGQRQANVARLVNTLQEKGALEYTIVIVADPSSAVLNQYLAPYVGATISEYIRDQGHEVLIVYDDLSNHAVAFREMSLLLRRSPGREAYPGDVFYLHSRLLERAGKLARGGSITALPIVQIQSDDITAYIPTNLISITDGQIFLDTKLFNQGVRPAVNIELSVSRVGGAAQTAAIKKVTRALRLELAQYHELLDFAQFGTDLDEVSQKKLARGARAMELLKQAQFETYSFVAQTLMLFLLKEDFLDTIEVAQVSRFATQFVSYVEAVHSDVYNAIRTSGDIWQDTYERLVGIAREFSLIFAAPEPSEALLEEQ